MIVTVRTSIHGHSVEVEAESLEEVRQVQEVLNTLVETLPTPAAPPGAPEEKRRGTFQDMLGWLRSEKRAHSKTYIAKNSGFSNSARLLTELKRLGHLQWHETLYESKSKRMKTMLAAYVDGNKPERFTPEEDQRRVLKWIRENPGRSLKHAEQYSGVVASCAEVAVNALLKSCDVELRQTPDGMRAFAVE